MKSKEFLHAIAIVLSYVGGALLVIALVRLLIVPVWFLDDGSAYRCGEGPGWGGILTALTHGSNLGLCRGASAVRMFSCVLWGGLGIGLLLAGGRIRDEVVDQD